MQSSTPDATELPELLSPQEFSEIIGWGIATVRRRIDAGELPIYQPGGKGTRVGIPRSELNSVQRRVAVVQQSETGRHPDIKQAADSISKRPAKKLPGPRPKWKKTKYNRS